LRERKSDIPLLLQHFLNKYSQETAKRVDRVSADTLDLLKGYSWPGNVRELENAVERAVVLSRSRTLKTGDFAFLQSGLRVSPKKPTLKELENTYLTQVLEENDWNVTKASGILGINRVTLHKKIKRLGLKRGASAVATNG
jgi:two-component system response regulator HydG